METRGRKRKTDEAKRLEGTARKDRANDAAPAADMTMPKPPAWLDENELKVWRRLAPALNKSGVLSFGDADSFGMFCVWLNKFVDVKTTAPNDVHTLSKCTVALDKLGAKFGYTPADRMSLKVDSGPKDVDPIEELLNRKKNIKIKPARKKVVT